MPRPRKADSRRVQIPVKVSDATAAAIDAARGEASRGAWVHDTILATLKSAGQLAAPRNAMSARPPAEGDDTVSGHFSQFLTSDRDPSRHHNDPEHAQEPPEPVDPASTPEQEPAELPEPVPAAVAAFDAYDPYSPPPRHYDADGNPLPGDD